VIWVEAALTAIALGISLTLRPWRLLGGVPALWTPLLFVLLVLPFLWALPALHQAPMQLQWSGAVLVLLMLGWPLAIPLFAGVAAMAWAIAPITPAQALGLFFWEGLVPATLALGIGAALRRWLPHHPMVYVLGRGFIGAILSLFGAATLAHLAGDVLPGIATRVSLVAHWLTAWGDAMVTGMLVAIFVAYRPQWLLTWSDRMYLHRA
jgi:uncharacterized membrane protein